jgi:hypothetical protein
MGLTDGTLALDGIVFSILLVVGNCGGKQVLGLKVVLKNARPVAGGQGNGLGI